MERLLALLLVAGVAACASQPGSDLAGADQQWCTNEVRTGSSIPVTQCLSRADIDDDKRATDRVVDAIRRAPTRPAAGALTGD